MTPRIAFVCVLTLFAGCTKGPYTHTTIADYTLLSDDLHLLVVRESGVNRESRFSDGNAIKPLRRTMSIVRVSLTESNHDLTLIKQGEFTGGPLLNADFLRLWSTNLEIVAEGSDRIDISTLPERQARRTRPNVRQVDGGKVILSAARTLLLGCGSSNWVTQSLASSQTAQIPECLALVCQTLAKEPETKVAISSAGGFVAFQKAWSNKIRLHTLSGGAADKMSEVVLLDQNYRLLSVHESDSGPRLLLAHLFQGKEFAVILDGDGQERGRIQILGDPVADGACTRVVSLGATQIMQLKQGERLPVKVWLPNEGKEYTSLLDVMKSVETH